MDNKEIRKSVDQPIALRQVADLKVGAFEWIRAKEGSPIGQKGDLILVLTGQGFMEADQRPVVHLGNDLLLRDTYVSEDMTKLYVVVPQLTIKRLERLNLAELSVQNAGLRNPREASFRRGEYFIEMDR